MRPDWLDVRTPYLLFTGKGGVGKSSLAAATALAFAESGEHVLLISTDTASNLDEVLGVALHNSPQPVPSVPDLDVMNIDPEAASEAYRQRAVQAVEPGARDTVREQLSGSCTTEVAVFDAFAALLADGPGQYTRIVFDTAPTGHTLRLLSLPAAWSSFLSVNPGGASCLGPHGAMKSHEARFRSALQTLTDPTKTTVVLVTLPETACIEEASRTARELSELGLQQQRLAINGVFTASDPTDAVAEALELRGHAALEGLPAVLRALPRDDLPMRAFDTVGLPALRALFSGAELPAPPLLPRRPVGKSLGALADELAQSDHGLIMVMGKGGVGKTTLAAALALGLLERGHKVHLSTTDPAAHLVATLEGTLDGLELSRIDPAVEVERYTTQMFNERSVGLDAEGRALMLEDLRSPCTEEVAVFHAFSRLISQARRGFVVLDTAPTGHSLLLIEATSAYHRQTMRTLGRQIDPARISTPLSRLQDASLTKVVLVTLPETTPVSQAEALQRDLKRAGIEPFAWVVNRSLSASSTRDPLLASRLENERRQLARLDDGVASNVCVVPWFPTAPLGLDALTAMTRDARPAQVTPRTQMGATASWH